MHHLFLAFKKLIIQLLTMINNAEDLDVVIPMYNLIEYSKNYRKTAGSFWNYNRDEPNKEPTGGGHGAKKYSVRNSKSFDYKKSITGTLEDDNTEKEAVIVVPLNHVCKFWKTLDMPLINCEINLILTWSENCVLTCKGQKDKFKAPVVMKIHNFLELIIQHMQQLK